MRWFVCAALVLAALSGCIGSTATTTAMAVRDDAMAAAQGWSEGAILLGAVAMELNEEAQKAAEKEMKAQNQEASSAPTDEDPFGGKVPEPIADLAGRADPSIGDGRAPAWMYTFFSNEKDAILFVTVAADGAVLSHADFPIGDEVPEELPAPDLGAWKLDSDAAVDAAREHSPQWDEIVTADNATAFMSILLPPEEPPVWLLVAAAEEAGVVLLAVDATNGTVQDLTDFIDPFEIPELPAGIPPEFGGQDVQLQFPELSAEFPLTLAAEGHPTLEVTMSNAGFSLPINQATLEVTSPAGDTKSATWMGPVIFGGESAVVTFDAPPVGDYQVRVVLDTGVAQNLHVSWCAPGTPGAWGDGSCEFGVVQAAGSEAFAEFLQEEPFSFVGLWDVERLVELLLS